MVAAEAQVRRRGFFLHSTDNSDPDTGEHENPEGFMVRVRLHRAPTARARFAGGRRGHTAQAAEENLRPAIRSGSVTGSRQRAHLPR